MLTFRATVSFVTGCGTGKAQSRGHRAAGEGCPDGRPSPHGPNSQLCRALGPQLGGPGLTGREAGDHLDEEHGQDAWLQQHVGDGLQVKHAGLGAAWRTRRGLSDRRMAPASVPCPSFSVAGAGPVGFPAPRSCPREQGPSGAQCPTPTTSWVPELRADSPPGLGTCSRSPLHRPPPWQAPGS